jgi:AraC family transcriptional regulator of adaptative response / DNA-3-methyladenine glycosylase II
MPKSELPKSNLMTRDDTFYKAMLARDHRFDGKFFVGVKTTGIYCRPICPAKPKRENVEFFQNSLEAEKAGYRPCLRCRPESAPLSAVWIGKTAVVQRALKVLNNQETLHFNEDRFADQFGISARHLRRLFIEEIGKTPKQLAIENRLALTRKLITETSLPMADIAFAAGFKSIRRFNDAFKARFKRSPSEIRRSPLSTDRGLKITLPYRPPFDFEAILQSYRSHKVGHLEAFESSTMHRIIELDGKVGTISISNNIQKSCLELKIDFPDHSKIGAIVSRVRAWFDVDSDPIIIANQLEADPKISALVKKHPGLRLPSGWDPFEVAISTILGQLVSVERGRALVSDLIEMLGKDSGLTLQGERVKLFPTANAIAQADLKSLKTTAIRKRTLIAFSKAVDEGALSLNATQDVSLFMEKLLAIPGIGPWTASYMALKALRHTDAFPATDLILARAAEFHSQTAIEKMSPWRGYVAVLFWREYAEQLKKTKRKKT